MRIRLIARIKNEELLSAMREAGYNTLAELSRATGIPPQVLGEWINFKKYPKTTKYGPVLEAALGRPLEAIFPLEYRMAVERKIKPMAELVSEASLLPIGPEALLLPSPDNVEELIDAGGLKDSIEDALTSLKYREARVLKMRFGLEDGNEHTLREVAEMLRVTPERIRQIETKALRKLKHPSCNRALRTFTRNYREATWEGRPSRAHRPGRRNA